MSHGPYSSLTRIVPKGGAQISGEYIPEGVSSNRPSDYTTALSCFSSLSQTIVGMSHLIIHTNPDIFPEPERFKPERWLESDSEKSESLDAYLVAFSRGPRSCLGIKYVFRAGLPHDPFLGHRDTLTDPRQLGPLRTILHIRSPRSSV